MKRRIQCIQQQITGMKVRQRKLRKIRKSNFFYQLADKKC